MDNLKKKNTFQNKMKNKINKNNTLFFILGLFVLFLFFLLLEFTFHKRTTKKIKQYSYDTTKKFKRLPRCSDIDTADVKNKVCEYNYCSSYNSLLVGNQKRDYLNLDMLEKVLSTGARYLEFEINPSNLSDLPQPVIGTGELNGNWSYSLNTIKFEQLLKKLQVFAFIKNMNYPLFIYFKFNSIKKSLINLVGEKIKCILNDFLIDNTKYNKKSFNFAQEDLCSLNNKIIFFSSLDTNQFKDTYFEKIVISNENMLINRMYHEDLKNYIPNPNSFDEINNSLDNEVLFREEQNFKKFLINNNLNIYNLPKTFLDMLMDEKEKGNLKFPLRHFNKFGITIVLPHKSSDIWTLNYDYRQFMSNGCQFITMNFQEEEPKGMFVNKNNKKPNLIQDYLINFKTIPIFLKNSSLRYIVDKPPPENVVTQYFESEIFVPNLYKVDFGLKSANKIYRLKNQTDQYLNISLYSKLKFDQEITNFKNYNFMIFSNEQISQSIMISPLNLIVPINYKNRHFLQLNSGTTIENYYFDVKKTFIEADQITDINKSNELLINSSFFPVKPKNQNEIDTSISFSNISDKKEQIKYFYNKSPNLNLSVMNDSNEEEKYDSMVFDIESVNNLKMFIYIRMKFDDKSYYYLKLSKTRNDIVFSREKFENDVNNDTKVKNDDSYKFQVIPSLGGSGIFKKQNFYLKASNGKYLKYECDKLKANLNSTMGASILKIDINSNYEFISLYNSLSGLYDRFLGINSNLFNLNKFNSRLNKNRIIKPLFISKNVVIRERKYKDDCSDTLVKVTEKLDKTIEILEEFYKVESFLEYK